MDQYVYRFGDFTVFVGKYYDHKPHWYQIGLESDLYHIFNTERNFNTPENAAEYARQTIKRAIKVMQPDLDKPNLTPTMII